MDPTARIVGPPGSANATISGDEPILTAAPPAPTTLEQPLVIAGIIITVFAAIAAIYLVMRGSKAT